jgi:hypothetical protein
LFAKDNVYLLYERIRRYGNMAGVDSEISLIPLYFELLKIDSNDKEKKQ